MFRSTVRRATACLLLLTGPAISALANTRTVTIGTDSGPGSLRQAVSDAASGDTIDLTRMTGVINLTSTVNLNKNLTLLGPGASRLTVTTNYAAQIFNQTDKSNITIDGLTLAQGNASNPGAVYGGAIHTGPMSSLTVKNCAFNANMGYLGGAIFEEDGYLTVSNCSFTSNGGQYGVAVISYGPGTTVLENSVFNGNYGVAAGGFEAVQQRYMQVTNCVFSRNTANFGAAIANYNGSGLVFNCTLVDNAGLAGIVNAGVMQVRNSILWGNGQSQIYDYLAGYDDGYFTFENCDIQGGWPGAGNIDADPLFVRAPVMTTDFGDLRLQRASPCVGTGSNVYVNTPVYPRNAAGIAIDLAGSPRIADGTGLGVSTVDMGAYELQPGAPPAAIEGAQSLNDAVTALLQAGSALPGTGQSLYAKLDAAIAAMDAGDLVTAVQKLQDFISQVKAFVKVGKLTSAQGQPLIDEATIILHLLGA